MNNPFSQSKVTYKISFETKFAHIEIFEELFNDHFNENLLSTSSSEIFSATVDSQPDDIWNLDIYINKKCEEHYIENLLKEFTTNSNIEFPKKTVITKVEDEDWVSLYQNSLKAIEIANFYICDRGHKDLCPNDKIGIFIDASRAFGTGDHATTSSCIESMVKLAHLKFNNIIDIGTGTGILSFAAEHLWQKAKIIACDVESVAVEIAHNNGEFNHSRVEFYKNTEDKILTPKFEKRKFDLVVSNILANPLIELASQIRSIATDNAYVILSGFLENQKSSVVASFEAYGFEICDVICKSNWVSLTLKVKEN